MDAAFLDFLCEAKRKTYASQGDETSVEPALPGSRQLEYRRGDYLYRDIYYGFAFFAGQETVYRETVPVWSMIYAGGVSDGVGPEEAANLYRFLRKALRLVPCSHPYRGPDHFAEDDCEYRNETHGSPDRFWGREAIVKDRRKVYELRYSGGSLR